VRRTGTVWIVVGLALILGLVATRDQYRRVGGVGPGFGVMESLLVGVGSAERGELQPFDLVRAVDGRLLASGRELQAAVAAKPPGTVFRYLLARRGQLVEVEVASAPVARRTVTAWVLEALLAAVLLLGLGALVYLLRPGVPQSRVFLAFTALSYVVSVTYLDAHTTYRFTALFLAAWAFLPATFLHLALIFPQRRTVARRYPRAVWAPYLASALVAALLLAPGIQASGRSLGLVAGAGAAYWGLALVLLVLALARTSLRGATPLVRARARVLTAAFAVGYLPPVLGTAVEAVFLVPVPLMDRAWKLNFVFPAAMAYALVRYNLFEFRTVLRLGTVYSVVTGLVVLGYAGAIALVDTVFSGLRLGRSGLVTSTVVALAVVFLLNPVYGWVQRLVDRLFFRQRLDVQHSLERVSEVMTGLLDLERLAALIGQTVDELLHPVRQHLLLLDDRRGVYAAPGEEDGGPGIALRAGSPLPAALARLRGPLERARLEEDQRLQDLREGCLAELGALGAEVAAPVLVRNRVTGLLALGPKRSGAAYSAEDLRLVRMLLNQSAVSLEHAKAYTALERANEELTQALRRVELLERIKANLAKFVPRTVQSLIEQAPEAPELDKREADVSVLFVDMVGYTRLSERLDAARLNGLVERYFGACLDEILRRGGDVNETAGDGLMAIFQDPDPRRHARAALRTALAIQRRTRELNEREAALPEAIALRAAINSGPATVGATKIEGGTGTRWTYTASGPVTNVAARLAALATAGQVLVGAETRRRLDGEFAFESLGEQRLRNVEQAVEVARLVAPAATRP
jgi:class 3 adenylate cyclase